MRCDVDVLIIGAGPAGSATAILMAGAGWQVALIEKETYPRQKVCGECIAAGNLELLDQLGVGSEFEQLAGPEIRQVGWMSAAKTVIAEMPVCAQGPYRYGRAIGRDRLDALLLERARAVGVTVFQPATARTIRGRPGRFDCAYVLGTPCSRTGGKVERTISTSVVIDAHGSWERGPAFFVDGSGQSVRVLPLESDLFAFKASFQDTQLAHGFLPIFAFSGGYGGMVVADRGRTTIACCIRRDALQRCRALAPGALAGLAVETLLRRSCRDLSAVLERAQREVAWLSVGPVRPGMRVDTGSVFRVGNAAGEAHPLIGEGISVAIQSAALLVGHLGRLSPRSMTADRHAKIQRAYVMEWRRKFAPRLRLSAAYAHIAMHQGLAVPAGTILRRWPSLLTHSARWVGKARRVALVNLTPETA